MFPKQILKDITQRAMNVHEESRVKIKTLNIMEERVIEKNTELLQLF